MTDSLISREIIQKLDERSIEEHLREHYRDLWRLYQGLFVDVATLKVGIGTSSPSANADLTLENGVLDVKETTTPTADADHGKVYTKNDNKLYFQDGAGVEHEVAFV